VGQAAAEVSGVPSAIRLAGDVKHHKVAAGAVEAAGLLPLGRLGKALKGAKLAAKSAHTTEEAVGAEKVAPYIAHGNEGPETFTNTVIGRGYSYHRTSVEKLAAIRREGLKTTKPNADVAGVYFGQDPLSARGLSWKSRKGSVYVRVKKSSLRDVNERAFGEHMTPHTVPPNDLEYFGADKQWHPVAAKAAEPAGAAELRDVLAGKTPKMGSAHTTEEAAKVREAIPGMRVAQGKQKALQSEDLKARVARAEAHLSDTSLPVEERISRAFAEHKGARPTINYKGLSELDEHAVQVMKADVLNHPHLMHFQKLRAVKALDKSHAGETLQKNEIDLLQHIFGKQPGLAGTFKKSSFNTFLSALNIPRSLMASFDLSAPFRQGLVVATRHPVIFFKNFAPMVKSFGSERVYNAVHDEIQSRASYPMMLEAKLAITKLGHAVGEREEQFGSDLAEKIPVAGRGVRASGRAYTAFLDKTRADVFDHLITTAQKQGVNVHNEDFLKDLGRYINAATGRGNLQGEHLQGAAKLLNAVFFSPRLLASRVDLIFSPLTYARTDPFVRKQAIRSMFQLAGAASTLLALASQIPGVKVVTDPRNPDWGKIKKGNTRIDIGGGFQQPLRLFAQVASGTAISSTTGRKLNLTANGFGQPTRLDLITRFFEGKESPLASVATDWARNSNQVGQKFTWGSEAVSHLTPLLAQDVYDVYRQEHGGTSGLGAAAGGAALGSLGFGIQSYGPKEPKAKSGSQSRGGLGSGGGLLSGGGGLSSGGSGGLLSGG
jgi:hypothetical protein